MLNQLCILHLMNNRSFILQKSSGMRHRFPALLPPRCSLLTQAHCPASQPHLAPPRRAGVGTMAACPGARRPPQEAPLLARGAGRGGARVCALRQLVLARTHLQMLALTGLTISCQYHCGSRLLLLLRCLNIGNH